MYIGRHVQYPLFLKESNETWIFSTNFRKKNTHIKFSENPSSWSRVSCGQMDITKLIVPFRSFAEKPKNGISMWSRNRLNCLCHEEKGNNNNMMMMMRTWRLGHLQSVLLVLYVWHRRSCSELLSRNCNLRCFPCTESTDPRYEGDITVPRIAKVSVYNCLLFVGNGVIPVFLVGLSQNAVAYCAHITTFSV
jgi:hypothetical protein